MSIKRCATCKGHKVVVGLGGMEKKCKACNGIGFAPKVVEKEVDEFLAKKDEPIAQAAPKKMGRPKKA